MTTKDHCLFFKNKQQQNFAVNENPNGHFNNLNLNQNNQGFTEVCHSRNVENHNKKISNYDSSHINDLQTRQKDSTLLGKTKFGSSFGNINAQKDYGIKEDSKHGKILNANNSTLSLHISAYENSIDATTTSGGEKDRTNKKKENILSIKNLKASVKHLQSAFELPRQQQDQKKNDPEVMQFKASQRLSNVNAAPSSSNEKISTLQDMSKKDDRRTSILKPIDENAAVGSGSSEGGGNKPKRRVSFHTHRTVKEFDKAELGVDRTPKNESIHYSGSSEERSSFFGNNRPGSALTYTSQQSTNIVVTDKNVTMNSTANETLGMFNRVENPLQNNFEEDTHSPSDQTLGLFGHLRPSTTTPNRNNISVSSSMNNYEDPTVAFIENLVPAEMLTPEVRSSPKRIAEIYNDLTRPVHISSPTSDKNPYEVDQDVTKAFETCTLSPVKHRQRSDTESFNLDLEEDNDFRQPGQNAFGMGQITSAVAAAASRQNSFGMKNHRQDDASADDNVFDMEVDDNHGQGAGGDRINFSEEEKVAEKTYTTSPTYQGAPMNSTYVVTAPSRGGMYLADESETVNPVLAAASVTSSGGKTYTVDSNGSQKGGGDIEMSTSGTSSSNNSFHHTAPKHSEGTKKKFRRLSDIINREKRRSSIFTAAASSAANSPAIVEEEENAQQQQQYTPPISEQQQHHPSTITTTTTRTVVNATINLSIYKSKIEKVDDSCDIYDEEEAMDTTQKSSSKENLHSNGSEHGYGTNSSGRHQRDASATAAAGGDTVLLEDIRTPTKLLQFEDSNFTMPKTTSENDDEDDKSVTIPLASESLESMPPMPKSILSTPIIAAKSKTSFFATPTTKSAASNFSFGPLPSFDKRALRREEASPKINQTPGWAKYSKCLEAMKKMSDKEKQQQAAIMMEDFDEEPNYLNGDSIMCDPITPKKSLSSMSYRQEYRDRNLEEPSESELHFNDDKENSGIASSHNNSTNLFKSASTILEHKSFHMSRLGCMERQFAPDKAFYIEKVIKEVRELKCMLQNLNIDLPGIEKVVPEFLIYDETLVITYYQLYVKIAIIDAQFAALNLDEEAKEKIENLKFVEEKLDGIQKAVDQVVDELKLTKFTYSKFLDKFTTFLVRLSNTNPEAYESAKKGIIEWNNKVDNLKAIYGRRMNEMNQEMKAQLEKEKKATAAMEQKYLNILKRSENLYKNALAGGKR